MRASFLPRVPVLLALFFSFRVSAHRDPFCATTTGTPHDQELVIDKMQPQRQGYFSECLSPILQLRFCIVMSGKRKEEIEPTSQFCHFVAFSASFWPFLAYG